ncbi:MAG: long-chain acyl-CoA synthetase [Gammaproteobacteria bacterium]|jgi:long-chain acyl-CoA synthetase
MYPGKHAKERADQPCIIMADSGETVTYKELEERSNQLAHLLREHGLKPRDHYAVFMENNARYVEVCTAGERAGLYYTCINSYLSADEVAYIVNNSHSKVLITSRAKCEIAREAIRQCPNVTLHLIVEGSEDTEPFISYEETIEKFPTTPIADECIGVAMLYSSGTTGRPKGILRPLPDDSPEKMLPLFEFLNTTWHFCEGMIYLSPAPLYHAAPLSALTLVIRNGGTCVVMEHFDPENYLALIEKFQITHTQLVPTMFSRMLKLPEVVRTTYDLSSLEIAIHAAAPCPIQVKNQMIDWWGPIIYEYYGATEGLGFAWCDTAEWLAHPGTVGRVILGELHILDDDNNECPIGTRGAIWFKTALPFEYFNDEEKTQEARSSDGSMSTVDDVGYVDEDGFLYLTDRSTFMIISGGVNIYPQECENLLITHTKVADAAVFGVPNEDLGEEVKAVVQPMPEIEANAQLKKELIDFCHEHLAHFKCPRSIDFDKQLPRLPTGKLYKRSLKDRYWGGKGNKII